MAKCLMVQGTASHVGKSVFVSALCRLLKNKGFRVAPFKAQNMSNNSFSTPDGLEIGRAQGEQAKACGIEPQAAMNPVLIKPSTDKKCQLVVMGKPVEEFSAQDYQKYKKKLMPIVRSALDSLMKNYEIVVVEGAGSPAEINLKKNDIVNMAVAKMAKIPVILTADIDKGGVFAQIVGTYELLEPAEKNLVKAFLINKFRGDKKLLHPGINWIEKRTKKKVLGVIPFMHDLGIADEDSVSLETNSNARNQNGKILIHVVKLPRISNFTDFKDLAKEKDVDLKYISAPVRNCLPDLLILPGTKSTIADLEYLRKIGLADYILKCSKAEVPVMGICGGYQMLGARILDPRHLESKKSGADGLGLIPSVTVFEKKKQVAQVRGVHIESGIEINGYEIHMGCTQGRNGDTPLFKITERYGMPIEDYDGVEKPFIFGTYIHGLFDSYDFRKYFLNKIRSHSGIPSAEFNSSGRDSISRDPFDALARIVEKNIDQKMLMNILNGNL